MYKPIDIGIKASSGLGQVLIQGASVFDGGVFSFTVTNLSDADHGNGWITAVIVHYYGTTVKGVTGLESYNNRDVTAFRGVQQGRGKNLIILVVCLLL